jgi:hypothetical protein
MSLRIIPCRLQVISGINAGPNCGYEMYALVFISGPFVVCFQFSYEIYYKSV